MKTNDLNSTFPANTFVFVGRRKLRHESEVDLKAEDVDSLVLGFRTATLNLSAEHEADISDDDRRQIEKDRAEIIAKLQTVPLTFVDVSNVKVSNVLEGACGKQGTVVDGQKTIRKADVETLARFRRAFDFERLSSLLDGTIVGKVSDEERRQLGEGLPYIVLDFNTAATKLEAPLTPQDMIEKIQELFPEMYDMFLAELTPEEQTEKVPGLWNKFLTLTQAVA